MKHIPDILTASRMVFSISLLLLLNSRTAFFVIFILCGITDVLDGYIARRLDTASAFGARLDSAADLVFYIIILICLFIWAGDSLFILLPYILAIVFIRIINICVCAIKFRSFAILHTWANKATGILVFISIGVYILFNAVIAFIPVCIIAALSAFEECAILIKSDKLDPDRKSIFVK